MPGVDGRVLPVHADLLHLRGWPMLWHGLLWINLERSNEHVLL